MFEGSQTQNGSRHIIPKKILICINCNEDKVCANNYLNTDFLKNKKYKKYSNVSKLYEGYQLS